MIPAYNYVPKPRNQRCEKCGGGSGYKRLCYPCSIGIEPNFINYKRRTFKKPAGIQMSDERYAMGKIKGAIK